MSIFVLITPIFIFLIYIFRLTPQALFQILTLATIIYLFFAIIHHLKDKSLLFEIVIEYILIAVLVLLIAQTVLF